jgi:hypothetical protein
VNTLQQDEFGSTHQPHRRHRESRLRQVLRVYRFEIIWLVIVALGVFLIFERLNIRTSLFAWFGRVSAGALAGAGRLDDQFGAFLARITLSDAIGFALILGAMVAIALRVRWRLIHNQSLRSATAKSTGFTVTLSTAGSASTCRCSAIAAQTTSASGTTFG